MARKLIEPAKKPAKNKKIIEVRENLPMTNEAELNIGAEYRSRCGGAMRAAREKQGLSTQEIANRLRLSTKQIEALEADNFDALPETTIVKGFIRNYAKQLKIDAEPLLDAYIVLVPSKQPQSFTLRPSADVKVNEYRKPNGARYAIFGLLSVLGLGAWLFYQSYVQKPNPVEPTAALVQPEALEPLPEAALPAAERAEETTTQLTLPNVEPSAEAGGALPSTLPAAPAATSTVPLAPQPPVAQETPNQADLAQAESVAGAAKLELNATQETWVSVTDATGKEIYSKTLFAGNREVIQAKPPLNITVGNSLGTTLSVNGKTVDLAPHTRVNVAHIKVD